MGRLLEEAEGEISGGVVDKNASNAFIKHDAWITCRLGDQEPCAAEMVDTEVGGIASQFDITTCFTALHWRCQLTTVYTQT